MLLEDGRRFGGRRGGAVAAVALGECVFATAMTGYQEALTDPSYAEQMLTFTAPMIGNYGVERDAAESDRVQVRARDLPRAAATARRRAGSASWTGSTTRASRW